MVSKVLGTIITFVLVVAVVIAMVTVGGLPLKKLIAPILGAEIAGPIIDDWPGVRIVSTNYPGIYANYCTETEGEAILRDGYLQITLSEPIDNDHYVSDLLTAKVKPEIGTVWQNVVVGGNTEYFAYAQIGADRRKISISVDEPPTPHYYILEFDKNKELVSGLEKDKGKISPELRCIKFKYVPQTI